VNLAVAATLLKSPRLELNRHFLTSLPVAKVPALLDALREINGQEVNASVLDICGDCMLHWELVDTLHRFQLGAQVANDSTRRTLVRVGLAGKVRSGYQSDTDDEDDEDTEDSDEVDHERRVSQIRTAVRANVVSQMKPMSPEDVLNAFRSDPFKFLTGNST